MEYLIITALQILGVGFQVMQKISALGDKFPQLSPREIKAIFWKEDWDTLLISFLVLCLDLIGHYVLGIYTNLPSIIPYYMLWSFGIALVLGYSGQWLIYKLLGTTSKLLEKKITEKLEK